MLSFVVILTTGGFIDQAILLKAFAKIWKCRLFNDLWNWRGCCL